MHRLARDLGRDLRGHAVAATSPQGRLTAAAELVNGEVVTGTEAYGKNVRVRFGDVGLRIHLGLIGSMKQVPADTPTRDTIRLRIGRAPGSLDGAETSTVWDLVAPQRCDVVTDADWNATIAKFGPDPLRRGAKRASEFAANIARRSIPLGVALLDQRVVAGVGNVYRSELAFLVGVDPRRPANSLSEHQVGQLWEVMVAQMRDGVKRGRIVTVSARDGGKAPGRLAPDESLYAYKRASEPCRRCGTPVASEDVDGRNVWWCPSCQS